MQFILLAIKCELQFIFQVKLDPTKKYKHRREEPKLSAEAPALTFSRKKAEKKQKMEKERQENSKRKETAKNNNDVNFSDDKIDQMKKLAQMLSQKIVGKSPENNKTEPNKINSACCSKTNTTDDENKRDETKVDLATPSTSFSKSPRHKSKHKEKKKQKDAKFEGEKVPHLVKAGTSKASASEEKEDGKTYATQDEYVLQKLFSKSGEF